VNNYAVNLLSRPVQQRKYPNSYPVRMLSSISLHVRIYSQQHINMLHTSRSSIQLEDINSKLSML